MPPHRRSIRLSGCDYRAPGAYFVTVCTQGRAPALSRIVGGEVHPTPPGRCVLACLARLLRTASHVRLDACVLMPDHLHVVFVLQPAARSLGSPSTSSGTNSRSLAALVQAFKSRSAHAIYRTIPGTATPFWQRGYYEHVVRSPKDLARIRRYIADNPFRWQMQRDRAPHPHPGTS